MAFYADLLTALDAAILARLNGNAVESYMIDGQNIQLWTLDEMIGRRIEIAKLAHDETTVTQGGSRIHYANLRPGG